MYAVIFRAEIAQLDENYFSVAERLRQLAINDYGCREFIAASEGKQEIAISYWDKKEHIRAWKEDQEHLLAQTSGRSKWYKSYSVQVVKVEHEYLFDPA